MPQPSAKSTHAAGHRFAAVRFDDEVEVIVLDRVMRDAEVVFLGRLAVSS